MEPGCQKLEAAVFHDKVWKYTAKKTKPKAYEHMLIWWK